MRIVFFGTPQFAVPTLQSVLDAGHLVCGVVTQPDRPRGRGQHVTESPVKQLARERHLIALRNASRHLDYAGQHAAQTDQSLDLFAEELRLAQVQLSTITGEFSSDDLLGVIFSRFCIGK